jgi:hypothetical protein
MTERTKGQKELDNFIETVGNRFEKYSTLQITSDLITRSAFEEIKRLRDAVVSQNP